MISPAIAPHSLDLSSKPHILAEDMAFNFVAHTAWATPLKRLDTKANRKLCE
jgi:hypothetical protein